MQFQFTVFITKNQHKRRQKQGIDMYVQLLTAPSWNRKSPPKRLFGKFCPMDLFSGFYGIYENIVLNYSQSRVSLN